MNSSQSFSAVSKAMAPLLSLVQCLLPSLKKKKFLHVLIHVALFCVVFIPQDILIWGNT